MKLPTFRSVHKHMKLPSLALAALLFAGLPVASSSAFVGISVNIAPPPLPVYEQPLCPAEGYIWTPGYWAYGPEGYYWVPGVWVAPPRIGVLWTPAYWGWSGGSYVFNSGYWGPRVGFYGGVNYGFGYNGAGYYGGEWAGDRFRYNTAVTRVNTTIIHNTYNRTVINNYGTRNRASYNGPGGVKARPTAEQRAAANAEHVPPTPEQRSLEEKSKQNRELLAKVNKGRPKVTALKSPDEIPKVAAANGAPEDNAGKGQQQQPVAAAGETSNHGDKPVRKAERVPNDRATEQRPQVASGRREGAKARRNGDAVPRSARPERKAQPDRAAIVPAGRRPVHAAVPQRAVSRQTDAQARAADAKKRKRAKADNTNNGGR
jgi:hypothetical protein